MIKTVLDNHDERIKHYPLFLERNLTGLPAFELPEGYSFVFYQDGDRDCWIEIELSARECDSREQGLQYWNEYFEPFKERLGKRMLFIMSDEGEKVATASALFDVKNESKDEAWLHWVAVKRKHQGKGLSKPLITKVLGLMPGLGYSRVKLSTHTNAWLACSLYMKLGFKPCADSLKSHQTGWSIIKTITGEPSGYDIPLIPEKDIFA